MKHSFSILLTMCILMIVGIALIPRLDIADKPLPRQGKTLTIWYSWHGASAKVIEQNITSRIEGVVSSVNGVESVESVSYFGSGSITIQLKKQASVSNVKFEIASLLRQIRDKLPKDMSYPVLSGGEVITEKLRDEKKKPLLCYHIHAEMPDYEIRKKAERELKPLLEHLDGISSVDISGGTEQYIEVSYDAAQLSLYGLTSSDMEEAIRSFLGRNDIIGDVMHTDENGEHARIALFLCIDGDMSSLESIPVKTIDDKIVYLNNLATCTYKEHDPDSYYRVNGMNTVYMNISVEEDAYIGRLADEIQHVLAEYEEKEKETAGKTALTLMMTYNRADEQLAEFKTLITRSGISLLLLLLFVYLCRRDLKYLSIITITLLANILTAVILYRLFNMRLHPFSMAGITVSLGLIIDSTIVMVDHYSYYRNYKAFYGILGAMLTTIGSLIIILWLPEYLKADLYDFSWMVIINLTVALLIAALFAPALVDQMHYTSRQTGKPHNLKVVSGWNKLYVKYIRFVQHSVWRWVFITVTAGIFAWSLYLFVRTLNSYTYSPAPEEMKLNIRGQMPLGGTAKQLNEKVETVEAFLSRFKEIKRYETNISRWGATITVEFKPEYLHTSFPYLLENKVIGRLITIGGADWSTYGVSSRGFSNSLNLQYRANSIEIAGYDYNRLYRFAEEICQKLKENSRVTDITIETPGHEHQEDELYMEYDKQMLATDSVNVNDLYRSLSSILAEHDMGRYKTKGRKTDIILRPKQYEDFDLWQLDNSFIKSGNRDIRVSDFMTINRREAKNCIPRKNQEYVLKVAFNVLGSYNYTSKYIRNIVAEFNHRFPVGFRCISRNYGWYEDNGTQYWLIGLVVVIIFFICTILFENLYQALVIILLIPFSLTGMFLTYHFSHTEFGTGGFAAMVLLCGLTVNAGIYLINEYNHNGRIFIKAYNHKIVPILLTVSSTVLGLLPFLMDGQKERFWFSFAIGSISGLLSSVIVLVFVFPAFLKKDALQRKSNFIP
ncbi:MAG: efflux RND transporter permease subunit [Bacteroidaceae bacterium]|nr:efflux RND transporter permease subunit [Bacteroidaceae bacterium]